MGDLLNSDLGAMKLAMDTNFWGTLRVLRAAVPLMPSQGQALAALTYWPSCLVRSSPSMPAPGPCHRASFHANPLAGYSRIVAVASVDSFFTFGNNLAYPVSKVRSEQA